MTFVHSYFETAHHLPPRNPMVLDSLFFILRDIFNLVVAAGIATTIVLAMRWQHSEEARLEAEAARAEAERVRMQQQEAARRQEEKLLAEKAEAERAEAEKEKFRKAEAERAEAEREAFRKAEV